MAINNIIGGSTFRIPDSKLQESTEIRNADLEIGIRKCGELI